LFAGSPAGGIDRVAEAVSKEPLAEPVVSVRYDRARFALNDASAPEK
jgi:hypothetical protein